MESIPAFDQYTPNEHPMFGTGPAIVWGTQAPDGDALPWKDMPTGSKHIRTRTTGDSATYTKLCNNARDDDWTPGLVVARQRISVADFTDGGSTAGTLVLGFTIPAGAKVIASKLDDVVGFAGNVSAAMTIGDGTDVDRYNTSTLNVFSNAVAIDGGAISGTAIHATAISTVTVTVTTDSNFTTCKSNGSGRATVSIYYYL